MNTVEIDGDIQPQEDTILKTDLEEVKVKLQQMEITGVP